MRLSRGSILSVGFGPALIGACSSSSSPGAASVDACNPITPSIHASIIGGRLASVTEDSAVVLFGACTGTRVGPRQILLAAHCVVLNGQPDSSTTAGNTVQYIPASALKGARVDATSTDQVAPLVREGVVDSLDIHPSYLAVPAGTPPNTVAADVAVITLHECLDASVAIMKVSSRTPVAGATVTTMGAGCEDATSDAKPTQFFVKTGTSKILSADDVRSLVASQRAAVPGVDDPISPPDVYFYLPGLKTGVLQGSDASEICHGDSGGPVIVEQDGARVIIGVNASSRSVSASTKDAVYDGITRVDRGTRDKIDAWLRDLGVTIAD